MILRKPYAFLIKYFRLIHIIMTAILAYIILVSRGVYHYLNKVINDTVNRYDALSHVNYSIFIFIFLALILFYIIYWLLKHKNKPKRMYLIVIWGYILIGIFLMILYIYMQGFLNSIPEIKTIRFYRDTMLIVMGFQYFFTIFMLLRGLGFDIKKFNFDKDAAELNVSESDSEEVEINTDIDTTNISRRFRKRQREFGYFYKEFKGYIWVSLLIVFGILGYKLYNYINATYKVYSENQPIGSIYNVVIRDSYYKVSGNTNYVIVSFDISKSGKSGIFNVGAMSLQVGNKVYSSDKTVCSKFSDLGTCYKNQYIDRGVKSYLLAYEVDNLNIQKAYIIYSDSYDDDYKVKLIMKEAN